MTLFQHRSSIVLSVILISATSVRLLGINFGLPYVFYPDEALIVNHAMAFGTGDLNPHYFVYPSLYMYLLFVIYGMTYVSGRLLGFFGSPNDFIHLFFTDATIFYLPGRLIAAFSGVATVWMVYRLGQRAYNLQVGLVAAALLSFSVLHVSYSHYVKTHVPAGLLVMIALWLAWSIYEGQNNWRRYVQAGAVTGLAASTVYHAGFALISIVVAHLLCANRNKDLRFLDSKLIAAVVSSLIAFILTTPFAVLDFSTFLSDLTSTGLVYYAGGIWEYGTFYPFTSLLSSFGQPIGAVALLGLAYALLRRRPADLILASQPIFLGLFLMLFRVKEPHHMLIAFPASSLLAASLVLDAIQWLLRRRTPLQPIAVATVAILLVIMPALQSFEYSYRLSLPDTRSLAKTWVEENIPTGSKIVMDSGKYYLESYGPPLPLSRWTLEQLVNRGETSNGGNIAKREGTRRTAYSGESAYFQHQLNALGERSGYDIIRILHDPGSLKANIRTLDEYADQGVRYAIVNSDARDAYLAGSHQDMKDPEKAAKYRNFYESLGQHGKLVKEFNPSDKKVGPRLLIYKIDHLPSRAMYSSTANSVEEHVRN